MKVKPEVPDFPSLAKTDLLPQFRKGLVEMAGVLVDQRPMDFEAFLRSRFPNAKNFCSAVPEFVGNSTPEKYSNWAAAGDVDVAIVRSPMGIA
jgi:L-lactate dehydrogenase complex protein LldG